MASLEPIPLLVIGLVILLTLAGAVALGYHGKVWLQRRSAPSPATLAPPSPRPRLPRPPRPRPRRRP
jgi:hypothetical protein